MGKLGEKFPDFRPRGRKRRPQKSPQAQDMVSRGSASMPFYFIHLMERIEFQSILKKLFFSFKVIVQRSGHPATYSAPDDRDEAKDASNGPQRPILPFTPHILQRNNAQAFLWESF